MGLSKLLFWELMVEKAWVYELPIDQKLVRRASSYRESIFFAKIILSRTDRHSLREMHPVKLYWLLSHEQSVIIFATKTSRIWESQGILSNFERIIGSLHENLRIASWVKLEHNLSRPTLKSGLYKWPWYWAYSVHAIQWSLQDSQDTGTSIIRAVKWN